MRRLFTLLLALLLVGAALTLMGENDLPPFVITREGEQKIILKCDT